IRTAGARCDGPTRVVTTSCTCGRADRQAPCRWRRSREGRRLGGAVPCRGRRRAGPSLRTRARAAALPGAGRVHRHAGRAAGAIARAGPFRRLDRQGGRGARGGGRAGRPAAGEGDVLAVSEVAGTLAAKRTAELIPLCHPLGLDHVEVDATLDEGVPGVRVRAAAKAVGRTGVEMEALTAVSVALLTVYDMVKAADRGMEIEKVRLLEKTGGTRGDWRRDSAD